jgi:hypothetical protein
MSVVKEHRGYRSRGRAHAHIYTSANVGQWQAEPLPPRLDLCRHTVDCFEWSYPGAGPAQLALAILADALGDDQRQQGAKRGAARPCASGPPFARPGSPTERNAAKVNEVLAQCR